MQSHKYLSYPDFAFAGQSKCGQEKPYKGRFERPSARPTMVFLDPEAGLVAAGAYTDCYAMVWLFLINYTLQNNVPHCFDKSCDGINLQ